MPDDLRDHFTEAEIYQLREELNPSIPPVRLGDVMVVIAFVPAAVLMVAGVIWAVEGVLK